MTINELKDEARSLRESKNYSDALAIYDSLWAESNDRFNEWDGWSYAFCLLKTQQYDKGIAVSRYMIEKFPLFINTKNVFCWCLYYQKIKPQVKNEDEFIKAANEIILHCKQEKYSPFAITVFAVATYINEKPAYNPVKILEWILKLNPELLEDSVKIMEEKDTGKEVELASDREKFFSLLIKAYFETYEFEKCLQACNLAFKSISKFHYDNDIWFKRKKAQCLSHKGELDESVKIYEEIIKKKSDWFIKSEIAELYFKMNDINKALKFACDAALSSGDSEKKMKLYELLANLNTKLGNYEIAKKHIALVYSIRKEHEWKLDQILDTIEKFDVNIDNLGDAKSQERNLKKEWEILMFGDKESNNGTIISILPNGKAGFIKKDDGSSYYFNLRSFVGRKEFAIPGRNVTFIIEDGFDIKKNIQTKIAVNVKPLK